MEQLLSMRLHSSITRNGGMIEILRVPGGWIYNTLSAPGLNSDTFNSVFVPYCEDKILSELDFYDKTRNTDDGPLDF